MHMTNLTHSFEVFRREALEEDENGEGPSSRGEPTAAWQRFWQSWTKHSLPSIPEAKHAFQETLKADSSELELHQLELFLSHVFSPDESALPSWLSATSERFIRGVLPWFPLWTGFMSLILNWCKARNYHQVILLARDSLPLYVVARQLISEASLDCHLRLLHVSRGVDVYGGFEGYLRGALDWDRPVAFVDTGCHGTIIAELARYRREVSGSREHLAVFFFLSQHPRIFGYMNYLMSWRILADADSDPPGQSARDFTAHALDVLEGMPKPYKLASVAPETGLSINLQDLVSFVLSMRLLCELRQFTKSKSAQSPTAALVASNLYRLYRRSLADSSVAQFFPFYPPLPLPGPPHEMVQELDCTNLAPQDEIFGRVTGR